MTHAARLSLTWIIQWWCQFFQTWCRLRVIDCLRPKNLNPEFVNNVITLTFFFCNKVKVGISKTPSLKPGMPKPQIICSWRFDVFAFVGWKIWKCYFFKFHCNYDIFVAIIARNMKLCTKKAGTPKWMWFKF